MDSGLVATRQPGPFAQLGHYVKRARERSGLTQGEVAKRAQMRQAQLSALENGANVEIQFYDKAARALNFRGALDLFTSGGDAQTKKLLRYWRALPDDEARNDALRQLKEQIVRDVE